MGGSSPASGWEHLLGRQPGSRAGSIPVPRATPTSICCRMELPACVLTEMRKGNSAGREGGLKFAPRALLGVAKGYIVTLSWAEVRSGGCGDLGTLAGYLYMGSITKQSLSFLICQWSQASPTGQPQS